MPGVDLNAYSGIQMLQFHVIPYHEYNLIPGPSESFSRIPKRHYRSGPVNSKSFVGKVFLQIK